MKIYDGKPVCWSAAIGLLALITVDAACAGSDTGWYRCTAWGGSHTGRYTFRIDPRNCHVYWKQIDRMLTIEDCAPPRMVVRKPFAPARGYVLRFNMTTGAFSDHVPGWADRGSCRRIANSGAK